MSDTVPPKILIAGAGSIGCYVGGCLALGGRDVRFLLRPRLAEQLQAHGMSVTDCHGRDRHIAAARLQVSTDARALADADIILVTVKSAATADIAGQIAAHARPGTWVVSLQNGVGNADTLGAILATQRVVAGMVGFNVVQLGDGRFHSGTQGEIVIAKEAAELLPLMKVAGLDAEIHADMTALLWGKLLLNLNNALNALSGLPMRDQLHDRSWRLILAQMMDETLAVLRAVGIRPAKVALAPPWLLPNLMRLPTPVFRRLFGATLKMDPQARTSMWEDLQQGRTTEIAYLQGAVIALAATHGVSVPMCRHVMQAVITAEAAKAGSPGLSPERLLGA